MTTKLAEAYVEITAKQDRLDSDLAGVESKLGGFSSRAGGLLTGIAAGLAAGGAAGFLREMMDAGADLGHGHAVGAGKDGVAHARGFWRTSARLSSVTRPA